MQKRPSILILFILALLVALPSFAIYEALLEGATENGAGREVDWPKRSAFGVASIRVGGTFGGATVTLQMSMDGGSTWENFISDGSTVTWTSTDEHTIRISKRKLRMVVSGATATTNLDAFIAGDA